MSDAAPCIVRPGCAVTFLEPDGTMVSGIVNGEPQVYWVDGQLATYLPVHSYAGNRNVLVAGVNVRAVVDPQLERIRPRLRQEGDDGIAG